MNSYSEMYLCFNSVQTIIYFLIRAMFYSFSIDISPKFAILRYPSVHFFDFRIPSVDAYWQDFLQWILMEPDSGDNQESTRFSLERSIVRCDTSTIPNMVVAKQFLRIVPRVQKLYFFTLFGFLCLSLLIVRLLKLYLINIYLQVLNYY